MTEQEFERRWRRGARAIDLKAFILMLQAKGLWVYRREIGKPPEPLKADDVLELVDVHMAQTEAL